MRAEADSGVSSADVGQGFGEAELPEKQSRLAAGGERESGKGMYTTERTVKLNANHRTQDGERCMTKKKHNQSHHCL